MKGGKTTSPLGFYIHKWGGCIAHPLRTPAAEDNIPQEVITDDLPA
jgi:hypothetical protein